MVLIISVARRSAAAAAKEQQPSMLNHISVVGTNFLYRQVRSLINNYTG
jgi:hypothetical protein